MSTSTELPERFYSKLSSFSDPYVSKLMFIFLVLRRKTCHPMKAVVVWGFFVVVLWLG